MAVGVRLRPSSLVVRSARSQYLDHAHGEGWLAIGDAALAFDPLASQGIAKALDHGTRAASHLVRHLAGDRTALAGFSLSLKADYASYAMTRASYYRRETRWQSRFWHRRHHASAALA